MNKEESLSWCGGFFDGEGSCSFATKCPTLTIVNTNPLAVTKFFEAMLSVGLEFKISERSKPSKSSKKKRWDLYMYGKENILKFIDIMTGKIHGKNNQLQLIKNFYEDNKYQNSLKKFKDYHDLMQFFNQTNNILIIDRNKLIEKVGELILEPNFYVNEEDAKIESTDFSDWFYVAGLMDAEGTFYINKRFQKNGQLVRYNPSVSVVNTNRVMISRFFSTLKNAGIGCHIQARIAENRNRVRWDVSVSGIQRTIKVNEMLHDKLIIKNRQSELMLSYSRLRLNNFAKNDVGESFKESIEALNKEN